MLKDRIVERFKDCDPVVQQIIADVLALEWKNLSLKKPRVKEEIDQIIEDAIKGVTQ